MTVEIFQPLIGIVLILLMAVGVSENKKGILWSGVIKGMVLQFILALVLLKTPEIQSLFLHLNDAVLAIQKATLAGTSLVFGYVGGGALPFKEESPGGAFILGFQALPMILIFSALSSVLYYWRVLPVVVSIFAWALRRVFSLSGATSFATIATVFVGMVEAPLLVRPYLKDMNRSELFIVMASGMATISGTVLVLYATFLQNSVPGAISHLLIASLISAPAAVMLGMVVVPLSEDQAQELKNHSPGLVTSLRGAWGTPPLHEPAMGVNPLLERGSLMDAISEGTYQGLKLLANVIAMLIVLVALVALVNNLLAYLPAMFDAPLTLQRMVGWMMAPLAWTLGIDWADCAVAGQLLGTKLVLNEFIAYLDLSKLPEGALNAKSKIIMTYLLCGFANFGSLGIVIGGLGAMAPTRKNEIINMGAQSLLVGMLATCLSGAMAAIILFGF
jgi:concentrative nucleoside transporter, CNT family